jgi:GNAT superfamily N-acetyltransferase
VSGEVELEHLWVSPEHIGTGIGRALFDHAVRRAAALGATTLSIEADPNAEGFYRRMGAWARTSTRSKATGASFRC